MKKRFTKILVVVFGITLCGGAALYAELITFEDDFNRSSTGVTTNGAAIGEGYVIPGSALQLFQNRITGSGVASPSPVLIYTALELNDEFSVAADVKIAQINDREVGVVFNFQDKNNYYYARIRQTDLQVRRLVGGVAAIIQDFKDVGIQADTAYRLTVSSSTPYNFDVSLVGGTLNLTNSVTDGQSKFTGGYNKLIMSPHSNNDLDNLSIQTIPEPGSLSLLIISTGALLLLRNRTATEK